MARSKKSALLTSGVCLILASGFTACDSSHKPETERVRELNEIPIAQLRVMLKG